MRAVVEYTVARCARAQVWVAPWLTAVAALGLFDAPSGRASDALALSAIVLFFATAWLGVATVGSHPVEQAGLVAAAVGGARRERLGALLGAALAGVALVPVSLVVAWVESRDPHDPGAPAHGFTGVLVLVALLGHLVACGCGVTVGAVLARPIVTSRTVALLVGLVVGVLLVVVPWAPVAVAVDGTAHPSGDGVALAAALAVAVAVAGAGVLWWTAGLAARRG